MFKIGDVVMLKSGGPQMTVTGLPHQYQPGFFCEWFNEDGAKSTAVFPSDALKIIAA